MKVLLSRLCLVAACTFAAIGLRGETFVATKTSEPTAVETVSAGARIARESAFVAYSPSYSVFFPPEGASIVVRKVERPDTEYATTSVVQTCTANADGTLLLDLEGSEGQYIRLLHELRDASGKVIGDVLKGDIAVVYTGKFSTASTVDSRTNSFQLAAEKGGVLALTYDSSWCDDEPAEVEISRVQNRYRRETLCSSSTNLLYSAAAACAGSYGHDFSPRDGGEFTYFCTFRDNDGNAIGEPLSAICRFKELWGISIIFK